MRKTTKFYPLIYVRYLLPLFINLALVATMFLPIVRFSLDTDVRQKMSLAELIRNTWENSRAYLFSSATQQTNDGVLFYRAVFVILIICFVLFTIASALNILSLIAAYSYFKADNVRIRNVYTSLIPNRCVMLLFELLLLPLMFLPDILVYLYRHLLLYNVTVKYSFLSTGVIALILLACLTAAVIALRSFEMKYQRNVFYYGDDEKNTDDAKTERVSSDSDENIRIYHINSKQQDQTERLRNLFGFSDEDKDDEDKNNTDG